MALHKSRPSERPDRLSGHRYTTGKLRKAIFPIGHYAKNEVREIAEREHLINAKRKDSQGICFLGNIDYTSMCAAILANRQAMWWNWRQEGR